MFGVKDEFKLGNSTRAYIKAYDYPEGLDRGDDKYHQAAVEAHANLNKPKLKQYMRQLLEDRGYNDEIMDSRLAEIALEGRDNDSMSAIKEYNSLKRRIDNKTEVSVNISGFNYINPDEDDNPDNSPD